MPTQADLGRLLEEYRSVSNKLESLVSEMKQLSQQLKHLSYALEIPGNWKCEVNKNYIFIENYHDARSSIKDTTWADAVRLLSEHKQAQAKKKDLEVLLEPYIGKRQ